MPQGPQKGLCIEIVAGMIGREGDPVEGRGICRADDLQAVSAEAGQLWKFPPFQPFCPEGEIRCPSGASDAFPFEEVQIGRASCRERV